MLAWSQREGVEMVEGCGQELFQARVLDHVESVLKASEILRRDICGDAPPEAECEKIQDRPASLAENLTWHFDALSKALLRIGGNLDEIRAALVPYQPLRDTPEKSLVAR